MKAVGLLCAAALVASCSGARLDRGVREVAAERSSSGSAATELVLGEGGPSSGGLESGTDPGGVPGAQGGSGEGGAVPGGKPGSAGGSGSAGGGVGGSVPGLFSGAEDRRGITDDEIRICVHAALTYAAAFNTGEDELNVYWEAINEAGGVHGRKVHVVYENDNYTPADAQAAATACLDSHDPFILLGGIGFDQIPAVRNFAEQRRVPYFHHTATVNGSQGKRYSFTSLPTTEKMGEAFAELAASRFAGQPVGIVKRQSENWEPGVDAFKSLARRHGISIVFERPVPQNKGSYLQDIVELQRSGAKVVWLWLNALETTLFIRQAKSQGFNPHFMVFPFNLTSQTLDADALNPPVVGVNMSNAYSQGDYSGPFAAYADDMRLFEDQYRKYRPNADLEGVGGDLLFLNWTAQKSLHQLLAACGPDCTRNRFIQVLTSYRGRPTSSACPVDFTRSDGGGHRGGWSVTVMEAYRAPGGNVNFRNAATCVEHLV